MFSHHFFDWNKMKFMIWTKMFLFSQEDVSSHAGKDRRSRPASAVLHRHGHRSRGQQEIQVLWHFTQREPKDLKLLNACSAWDMRVISSLSMQICRGETHLQLETAGLFLQHAAGSVCTSRRAPCCSERCTCSVWGLSASSKDHLSCCSRS